MRDPYNVQQLNFMLNEIREDEYALARLKSDSSKTINLDEGALNLLVDYYSGKITASTKTSTNYVKASDDIQELLGYGINYRDMHTAIHGIIWSPDENLIYRIDSICRELENTEDSATYDDYLDELMGYLASNEIFLQEEINFRDITKDDKYYCDDGYIQIINPVAVDMYW